MAIAQETRITEIWVPAYPLGTLTQNNFRSFTVAWTYRRDTMAIRICSGRCERSPLLVITGEAGIVAFGTRASWLRTVTMEDAQLKLETWRTRARRDGFKVGKIVR